MKKLIPIASSTRTCGTCNKCCEGWLFGEVNNKKFWPGRPCHYIVDQKCSIYETRPVDPCVKYSCQWLTNPDIPGWLKPSEVNAIISLRDYEGIKYIEVVETGEKLRSEVLSWVIMYTLENQLNLKYHVNGGSNKIGSADFFAAPV